MGFNSSSGREECRWRTGMAEEGLEEDQNYRTGVRGQRRALAVFRLLQRETGGSISIS
jgi:hypothetical protein